MKRGNEPLPCEELDRLPNEVRALRSPILKQIGEAVIELQPDGSNSQPDLFGQSLFTLVHHMEQAIANGEVSLIKQTFPKVLLATMVLEEHIISTYGQQMQHVNPALFDPVVDLLDISGLAVIYEALRKDCSADPVRTAWDSYIRTFAESEDAAKRILNVLDAAQVSMPLGLTPRNMARTAWEQRLSDRIVEAGYAIPEDQPYPSNRVWKAPLLIKTLGVSEMLPSVAVDPRAIFAAEVLGPLTGESEQQLRKREGIKRYFEARDRHISP